jgi:hypothetical protein
MNGTSYLSLVSIGKIWLVVIATAFIVLVGAFVWAAFSSL